MKNPKATSRFHTCRNDSTAGSLSGNAMPARFDLMNSTLAST
jgi:hypothetical protein